MAQRVSVEYDCLPLAALKASWDGRPKTAPDTDLLHSAGSSVPERNADASQAQLRHSDP